MSLSAVDALIAALYMRAITEGMEVCKGFKLRGLEEDEDEDNNAGREYRKRRMLQRRSRKVLKCVRGLN